MFSFLVALLNLFMISANVTQENSPGFVRLNDPAYLSLPAERREPSAPIDPSSELFCGSKGSTPLLNLGSSVNKWFYISSAQV